MGRRMLVQVGEGDSRAELLPATVGMLQPTVDSTEQEVAIDADDEFEDFTEDIPSLRHENSEALLMRPDSSVSPPGVRGGTFDDFDLDASPGGKRQRQEEAFAE